MKKAGSVVLVVSTALLGGVGGLYYRLHQHADPAADAARTEADCRAGHAEMCARAGTAHLQRGDLPGAQELASRGMAADPANLHCALLDAGLSEREGDIPGARRKYQGLEKAFPHSGMPAADLALLSLAEGDLPGADAESTRAVAADRTLALAHVARARVLAAQGKNDLAVPESELAMSLDPYDIGARLLAADLYLAGQAYSKRLAVMEEAARIAPRDPVVMVALGQSYELLGQFDQAAEVLRAAGDALPGDARIDLALGRVYLEEGKTEFAVPRLRNAVAVAPKEVEPRLLLAAALSALDPQEARGLLDALLTGGLRRGEEIRARRARAELELQTGEREAATADVTAALALSADDPSLHELLGHLLLESGRYDPAAAHLQKAADAGDGSHRLEMDLARLAAHQGRDDAAVAALEALSNKPGFDKQEIRAQPEFAGLGGNPRFRWLMETR